MTTVGFDLSLYRGVEPAAIADGWITGPGLAFAAVAAVELTGLRMHTRHCGHPHCVNPPCGAPGCTVRECGIEPCHGHRQLLRRGDGPDGASDRESRAGAVLARVRAALAAAPDDVHAAVLDALAPLRGTLAQRIATSFLAPDRTAWVDADAQALSRPHGDAPLLLAAAHTAAQVAAILPNVSPQGHRALRTPVMFHTLAEGVGDALLDVYPGWRGHDWAAAETQRAFMSTLAAVPTDRAFLALLGGLQVRGAQAAVESAGERFPDRAMRLLTADADRPAVAELLRRHIVRYPALAPGAAATAGDPAATAPPSAAPLSDSSDPTVTTPLRAAPAVDAGNPTGTAPPRAAPSPLADDPTAAAPHAVPSPGSGAPPCAVPSTGSDDPTGTAPPQAAATSGAGDPTGTAPPCAVHSPLADDPTATAPPHAVPSPGAGDPAGTTPPRVVPSPGAVGVPSVLVTPPWTRRRRGGKPVVVAGLRCDDEPAAGWPPGARARLLGHLDAPAPHHDPVALAAQIRDGSISDWVATDLLRGGPAELAVPLLAVWEPTRLWGVHYWLPRIAARFGVAALPLVLRIARRSPADGGQHLLPFTAPEVALLVADWHGRLKAARVVGLDWLRRHPEAAARALVPAALARPGPGRRHAGQALLALAAAGHRATVLTAADGYGPVAGAAILALLDTDPLDVLPPRIPVPPAWADPAVLPPVRLRDGTGALPAGAVRHLLTMLMLSRPGDPYAGLAIVRAACDPHDLARFAWVLLQRWEAADAPPADSWALDAQAPLGDDETAVRLAAAVRAWPYQGAHQRAAAGLDTLAHLGTDAALSQLQDIATKMQAKAVKARAELKLREVAETLELTAEQLADRLVPRLDLSPDATLTLDYGPRRFVIGFDEQLRPYVIDGDGNRRSALPAPAGTDDERLAPAAQRRFADTRKAVRKVGTEQVRRLEQAMVLHRSWTGAEFRRTFLEHPLLWPIARRLVWMTTPGGPAGGTAGVAVRLAEDRTFAGADDGPVALTDATVVRVAHPVHLDVPAWTEVFADYAILQPFPQLARDVHALTADELGTTRLTRFDGRTALTVKLLALERRGWRGSGQEGGYQLRVERDLPGARTLIVDLDPGIMMGVPTEHPKQSLHDVWICPDHGEPWTRERTVPFTALDPASVSELLRDLGACF